jgi:S-DNA-T family DNA segregation ATPase FtsK/SpoIIIE
MPATARGMVRHATPAQPEAAPPAFGKPAGLRADPRYPEPLAEAPHYAPPREKVGFLARMPSLLRRAVEPELVEPVLAEDLDLDDMPDDDRIKARISSVIRARTRAPEDTLSPLAAAIQRREPSLNRPRGPEPLIANIRPLAAPGLRSEPPVLGGAPAVPPQVPAANAFAKDDFTTSDQPEMDDDLLEDDLDWQGDIDAADDAAPQRVTPMTLDRRPVVQHVAKKPVAPSTRAMAEAQPRLRFDDAAPAYELPPLSLLTNPTTIQRMALSDESLEENARMLETVLDDYGVKGEIVSVRPGPVVTMYELEPAPGLKASRVIGLADDIARSMSALSARVSTVPGRTVIGIELPNVTREKVVLREILAARDFGDSNLRLPLALGKDIGGDPIVANLAKMPHLLIAGTTGSGKSVAINTMILSLLYKLTPEECRLIMIDPKMLELSVYDGIPHLLSPVVTDPKKAVVALKWVVGEMEERYRKMSKMGVRNIEGYNGRVKEALAKGEMFKRTIQTGFDEETGDPVFETEEFAPVSLPYIVVIVDEMADLMMVAGKEIEACIQRLAQMARASGIHLIMATQRPSVDVITGTIKANFPTRISFQVTSKIDSRTILGEQGAEQLLGMGDMLYMAGGGRISRIHGPFVSDEEVEEVVNHLKSFGPPSYMSGVVEGPEDDAASDIDLVLGLGSGDSSDDALYDQAVAIVAKDRKCSTSYIQRKLGIGYNKAARLVEQMEEEGVVTPANHVGKREILVPER